MPNIFAPPPNPPPRPPPVSTSTTNHNTPAIATDADGVPHDPPPAYSATAGADGPEQTLAQGPNFMDFSGPPPVPDRMPQQPQPYQQQYQTQHYGNDYLSTLGSPIHGQNTGYSSQSPSSQAGPSSFGFNAPSHPPPLISNQSHAGPVDKSPTDVPTPGRPLLHEGKVLIYSKGHVCSKCHNTGYKNEDPQHPCKTCWKKHSRPYTSAIAHSWPANIPSTIDTTTQSQNYQRPLLLAPPAHPNRPPLPPTNSSYAPGPRPGGGGGAVMNSSALAPGMLAAGGGSNRMSNQQQQHHQHHYNGPPQPPPSQGYGPPPQQHQQPYGGGGGYNQGWGPGHHGGGGHPPPTMVVRQPGYGYGWRAPPGSIVVMPGDPRLGGYPCMKCGGSGERETFFGFDSETCWQCQGVGRVY